MHPTATARRRRAMRGMATAKAATSIAKPSNDGAVAASVSTSCVGGSSTTTSVVT